MDVAAAALLSFFIGLVMVLTFARRNPPEESSWLVTTLLIGLVLRLGAATMFAVWPESRLFHEDAGGYEWIGQRLANEWRGLGSPIRMGYVATQNYGYYYVSGAIMYLSGGVQSSLSYFNCLIGTASIYLVYRTARELFHVVVARRAALLTAVIPSMVLWSAVAIKDALMVFLILISLYSCIRLKRQLSTGALLGTVLPIIAVQPIRFYMLYILTFAVLISLFVERGTRAFTGVGKQLVVGGGVLAMLVVFGFAGRASEGTEYLTLEKATTFRYGMAMSANSGFSAETDVSTPGRAIAFLPVGVSTLLFAPFPWQMTSVRAAMAAPEMLLWWALIPSLIRGLLFVVRRKFADSLPLLAFAATLTLAYSLVHGNVGAAFRQRAQIFVLLFIFASLGTYVKTCRKRNLDENLLLKAAS